MMNNIKKTNIGNKLKTIRKKLKLTQKVIADLLNLKSGHSIISKYENNAAKPGVDVFLKYRELAKMENIEVDIADMRTTNQQSIGYYRCPKCGAISKGKKCQYC